LDRSDAGGSNAGSKLIQQSEDEGDDILYEPHSAVSDLQQRQDKFQLDGTGVQLYTDGGWKDAARVSSENDQTTSSHVVFTPATTGDNITLEDSSAS